MHTKQKWSFSPSDHSQVTINSAALLTLGAALIHFAVVPEHLQEYLLFGIFFIAVGLAQVALAFRLFTAPSRQLLVAALVSTVALVALWVLSRTTGLPIGPEPWKPEDMGVPDIICIVLEVVSILIFLVLLLPKRRPVVRRLGRMIAGTIPVVVLVGLLTSVGVESATNAMPVAFNASPPIPGQPSTSLTSLVAPPGPQPVKNFTLTAQVKQINGQQAWTYNGTVPGPELRVTQGDRVRVTLINHLPVSTTIHWHGVDVPNAEDGVAGLTQDAVAPGGTFVYDFIANDVGTYWYHSHQDTANQIPQGLFGAFIVEPPSGHVAQAHDYTVMLHLDQSGTRATVNGVTSGGDLHLDARPGETVRLRLVNAVAPGMDGGPEAPVLLGAPYQIVALDGHDLSGPQLLGPERIPLGIGQRADLVFTMPAHGAVRLIDTNLPGEASAFQSFLGVPFSTNETVTIGTGAIPTVPAPKRVPLFDETHYGTPTTDAVAAGPFGGTYPVVLDEGPGFHGGRPDLVHSINGQATPYVPPITVHLGEIVRLHIVNRTGEFHPIHIHGHIFSVLAMNGSPISGSPLHLDTVLVGPHETADVAFLANNPGIWMLHCHVLMHAAEGMSMTINYVGITTPFEMGSRSGNMPE